MVWVPIVEGACCSVRCDDVAVTALIGDEATSIVSKEESRKVIGNVLAGCVMMWPPWGIHRSRSDSVGSSSLQWSSHTLALTSSLWVVKVTGHRCGLIHVICYNSDGGLESHDTLMNGCQW